jgi:hypothetical protein
LANQLRKLCHHSLLKDDVILFLQNESEDKVECPRIIVVEALLEERLIVEIKLETVESIAIKYTEKR